MVLGARDVRRTAEFWCRALGYVPRDGEIGETWAVLSATDGAGPNLSVGLSQTPPREFPRVHLDLYAGGAADQAAEVARLVGLGARLVDWPHYPDDADFVVLADPEDNIFCVIDTGG